MAKWAIKRLAILSSTNFILFGIDWPTLLRLLTTLLSNIPVPKCCRQDFENLLGHSDINVPKHLILAFPFFHFIEYLYQTFSMLRDRLNLTKNYEWLRQKNTKASAAFVCSKLSRLSSWTKDGSWRKSFRNIYFKQSFTLGQTLQTTTWCPLEKQGSFQI